MGWEWDALARSDGLPFYNPPPKPKRYVKDVKAYTVCAGIECGGYKWPPRENRLLRHFVMAKVIRWKLNSDKWELPEYENLGVFDAL